MSVTRFGVSLLNVVATIESPASHQGTARPDAKNSDVFVRPAGRRTARARNRRPGVIGNHDPVDGLQMHGCVVTG